LYFDDSRMARFRKLVCKTLCRTTLRPVLNFHFYLELLFTKRITLIRLWFKLAIETVRNTKRIDIVGVLNAGSN